MKTLLLTLLSIGGLLAQSTPPNQLQIYSPAPSPVRQIGGGTVGQSGSTTLYYWVIARYSSGIAVNTTPVAIFNTVGTANLTASNYVSITWGAVGGATGYDVLRSTTPIYPANPTCTACAVTLNTPNSSITDTGAALSDYPPGGLVQSSSTTATIYIDNSNSVPYLNTQLLYRATENLIVGLISGSIADGDCIEYSAGRLVSAGAGCGSGGGLGDPGSNGIVVRTALNTTVARTLQEGTNITITYPDGVSGNPVINASGGGSASTPFAPTRTTTSATNDTINLNCDTAPYCAIRVNGVTVYTYTTDITAQLSGTSNTNSLYIYYTPSTNTIYCDENTTSTLTVAGCTAATTGGVPTGSIPLGKTTGTYAFTANVFADPSTSAQGPLITSAGVESGNGVNCPMNGTTGIITCAIDPTVVPTKNEVVANSMTYTVTAGTSTVYTLTTPFTMTTANANGVCVLAKMDETSGATPTLAVNGETARPIYKHNGTSAAGAVATGDLIINQIYNFCYNTSLASGAWVANYVGGGGATTRSAEITIPVGSESGGNNYLGGGWFTAAGLTNPSPQLVTNGQEVSEVVFSMTNGADTYKGYTWRIPAAWNGSAVTMKIQFYNGATSGNVLWNVWAACIAPGTDALQDLNTQFTTGAVTANPTVSGTSLAYSESSFTLPLTAGPHNPCTAGDIMRIKWGRVGTGDTATQPMYVPSISLNWTETL